MASKQWKDKLQKLVSDISGGEVNSALEELEKLFQSSLDFLRDWKERDHSQPLGEEWKHRIEQNEFFLTITLPKILKIALNRKITDDIIQQSVNCALQRIIQVIVLYFHVSYDLSPLFSMLMEIFDDEYNFYSNTQYAPSGRISEAEEDGPWARSPYLATSCYFVSNLNYFGECGGFSVFLQRIEGKEPADQPPFFLRNVQLFMTAISQVRKFWRISEHRPLRDWVQKIYPPLHKLMLELPDNEYKQVSRKELRLLMSGMENILRTNFHEQEVSKAVETLQLQMALKALKNPALNKRLDGLHQINLLIEMIVRKEAQNRGKYYPSQAGGRQAPPPVTKWLDANILSSWIHEIKLIDILFDSRIHYQIVGRTGDIFRFLAQKKQLDPRYIDILWECTLGNGREEIQKAVYDILIDIAADLPLSEIDKILAHTSTLAPECVDAQTMKLQKHLSIYALHETGGVHPDDSEYLFGLDVFWKWIQDGGGLSVTLQSDAVVALCEVASRSPGQHRRWIRLCVDNLSRGDSVSQSLDLLQRLLDSLPIEGGQSRQQFTQLALAIDNIEKEFDLLDKFFADLVRFKKDVAAGIEKLGVNDDQILQMDWNVEKIASSRPYMRDLSTRMEFLYYLLRNSNNIVITQEHINALWNCLIVQAICKDERELCYRWLQEVCGSSHNCFLQAPICEYIFLEKLCRLKIETLEDGAFLCWERYFIYVNVVGSRAKEWPEDIRIFIILHFELLGIEFLWNVVFSCLNESVVQIAMGCLHSIHKNLAPSLQSRRAEFREEFIRTVMLQLSLLSQKQIHESDAAVLRAISILRDYIIVMEGYPLQSQVEVNFRYNQKGGARLTLAMSATDSLLVLRDRLAERISKPSCCVRLMDSQGSVFFDNDLTVYTVRELELKKDSFLKFDVNPIFPDSENVTVLPPDLSILPSYILANTQQFFDQLWNLLSTGGEISSQIWDLISMIPTNSVLASRLTSISKDTPWSEVLDPTSSYRLEYALRIMKSIAFGEGNCEREDWITKFEQFGGVQHLYDVFFREDVERLRASLRPICLASLLDVLGFFLLVEIRKSPEEEEAGRPSKELRESVLNLRASAAEGAESQKLNFTLLTTQLLRIIETAAEITQGKPDSNEGELVREASKLFFATVFSRPEYVAKLVAFPNLEGFLRKVLLESQEPIIRCVMAGGFKELVAGSAYLMAEADAYLHKFLPIVFEFVFTLPHEAPLSDSFFEMITEIIRIGFAPRKTLTQSGSDLVLSHSYCFDITEYVPIEEYLDRVVAALKAHPCVEVSDESYPDEKLVGLLGIVEVFCTYMDHVLDEVGSAEGKGLAEEIFFSCLFELPTPSTSSEGKAAIPPPKCKTAKSRTYALRALQSLARGKSKSLFELLNSIKECHLNSKGVDCSSPWGHNPAIDQRSKIGYAGIKNLGCICYMNSLLQQFYMIPYFRCGMLAIDFDEIEKKKEVPSNLEEQVVYQLQVMFAYLKETQKQYYNPRPFTNSFKDASGNVMDVSVQMDVDEFFNILCDKIETYLKGTPQASLLKSLFNGKEAMQLIGHCGHRKENECDFNVMTLTIKGKNSVLDALSSFVQGDLLDGDNAYFCDGCNKKVDTLKRTCIKILPNVLLLHLKRFDFDFDTMRNEKVNDYCEFPLDLDMEPYTREGLSRREKEKKSKEGASADDAGNAEGEEEGESPQKQEEGLDLPSFPRDYYEYELRGVLVHRGVADSGHYYSFIKERGGSGQWIEFNDETVRLFDPSNLGQECFGGEETITQYNEQTKQNVRKSVPITRNAYMLIYERKVSKPFQLLDSKGEPLEIQHGILDPSLCVGEKVPSALYELVWKHNIRHQQDVWVFDKAYLDTLTYLEHQLLDGGLDKLSPEQQFDLIQLFGRLFLEVVSHSQERELITQFAAYFVYLLGYNAEASKWLLRVFIDTKFEGKNLLLLMLLNCHVEETREACAALLVRSFRTSFMDEREVFLEKCVNDTFESDASFRFPFRDEESAPLTLVFIRELLKEFKFMPYNWRTFSDYFLVLREIAFAEPCIRAYFLQIGFLPRLFDLFLGEESPNAKKNTRKMGDKYTQPDFTHLLSLISILVCSLQVPDPSQLALPIIGDFQMNEDVMDLVDSAAFMKRLGDQKNVDDVARMLAHLCYKKKEYSTMKLKWIHDGIHGAEHDGMRSYFCLLLPILDLEDGLQSYRVNYFMGKIGKTIEHFKKYPMFTKTCIEYTYAMRCNPAILKYMNENIREWEENLNWAKEKAQTTSSFTQEAERLSNWKPYYGSEQHFSQKLWEFGEESED